MHSEPTAAGRLEQPCCCTGSGDEDALLAGPIPKPWFELAARLPGKSLHLALMMWCAASLAKSRRIPISNVAALVFGIDRSAKYRALNWLEEAGLILVERRIGCVPIVTLLDVGGDSGST